MVRIIFALMPFIFAVQATFATGKPAGAHSPDKLSGAGEVMETVVPFSISSDPQVNLSLRLKVLSMKYAGKKSK